MQKDWFPGRQPDLVGWYENFQAQAPAIAKALKLDPAAAQAGAAAWLAAYAAAETARTAALAATKTLQAQDGLSEEAARAFIKQLKATPGVTAAQIELLQASGPDTAPTARVAAQAPVLELSQEGGHVEVKFKKLGHQGILLYGQRGPETEWTLLGLDTFSPYLDNRPNLTPDQAETRRYRAYFCERDQPVGDMSAEVAVAVRG